MPQPLIPPEHAERIAANLSRALQPVQQLAREWEQDAPRRHATLREAVIEMLQRLDRAATRQE